MFGYGVAERARDVARGDVVVDWPFVDLGPKRLATVDADKGVGGAPSKGRYLKLEGRVLSAKAGVGHALEAGERADLVCAI